MECSPFFVNFSHSAPLFPSYVFALYFHYYSFKHWITILNETNFKLATLGKFFKARIDCY